MAEAIVFIFTEQLISTIRLELQQKVRLVVGVRKEVEILSTTFRSIQALLQDAEKKQITSAEIKNWLGELKHIAYDVEDVLDEWKTRILISLSGTNHQAARNESRVVNKVLSCFSSPCYCFHPLVVRYDIAHRIKLIRERFDEVARNKDQFKFIENQTPQERPRLLTSSIADVSKIYGRDYDKEAILSRLLGDSSSEQEIQDPATVTVVSIVGTGGFGKTTLAQLIYQDANVVSTFELKIWVCVSEPFEHERVAKEIIKLAGGNAHDAVGWEDLHQRLCASVKGKRFLLVLDDVWSDDNWGSLKLSLDGGAPGSRIVVTTRDENVAKLLGSTHTHRLGELSFGACWSLFQQIAFLGRPQEDRERLEAIGEEITRKCKGVPLAVKTIAGLMRVKETKEDWRNVLASDIWKVEHLGKGFLPALLLSYHALPSCLKQCFQYCATFRKDKKMKKDVLVKLWMAQGYLDSDGEELEMIGGVYFNNLAMRSFFQDFEKDSSGSIVSCKMHDLVHDLAQSLTEIECAVVSQENDKEININCNKVRHMTYFATGSPSMIFQFKNLRTLMLKSWEPPKLQLKLFHQLTCLRALDLSRSDIRELPSEFGGLLHLRYLDLSYNSDIVELPETICNLYNLQTLKLNWCSGIHRLPKEIGSLVNLRHLEMDGLGGLNYTPTSIGRLHQLRTLSKLVVSGHNGGCTIGELGKMKYLSGQLKIIGLRQVGNANEAKHAELQKKTNITSLELCFVDHEYWIDEEEVREDEAEAEDEIKRMESVLEGLEPHKDLETLTINGYAGMVFPRWMLSEASSSLSSIVTLVLVDCKRCSLLPPGLGKLQYLGVLVIGLGSMKQLGPDFCGGAVAAGASNKEDTPAFPKLKYLELQMKELEDWVIPSSKFKKFMPCLRELWLSKCTKLRRLPALARLESLEKIRIENLPSLETVGVEFLGISDDEEGSNLKRIGHGGESERILPRLREFIIIKCPKLKTMPALVKLQSLECLCLRDLNAVKHVSSNLFGISRSCGTNAESSSTVVLLPNLKELTLGGFQEWEEEIHDATTTGVSRFPSLTDLTIERCEKLKVVPHYLFSPHLESLTLSGDVGALSRSLLPIIAHNNTYPNLKSFLIWNSPHSLLPQGLNQLTSLQNLVFDSCELLDFKPEEELRHLPMLRMLDITQCPVLRERCSRENWSISLSHIPNVYVDDRRITSRN